MRGRINKIWENSSKEGQKYWVLSIDGKRYSVFDGDYVDGLEEGSVVEYDANKKGKYNNITALKKIQVDDDSYLSRKDEQIIRMSCLKSASELLSGIDMEPDKKADAAIGVARKFQRYVKDEDVKVEE